MSKAKKPNPYATQNNQTAQPGQGNGSQKSNKPALSPEKRQEFFERDRDNMLRLVEEAYKQCGKTVRTVKEQRTIVNVKIDDRTGQTTTETRVLEILGFYPLNGDGQTIPCAGTDGTPGSWANAYKKLYKETKTDAEAQQRVTAGVQRLLDNVKKAGIAC